MPCQAGQAGKSNRLNRKSAAQKPRTERVKKLCWHTTSGDIRVEEPQYRRATKRIRPFSKSTGVRARGCSRPLQRAITDIGADMPYAKAMDKLVEHYGVIVPESTIARITQQYARVV